MISKLIKSQEQDLLSLPESGMGYQLIEAEIGIYGRKSKFLVLNSQMIIEDTPQISKEVHSVFIGGYSTKLFSVSEMELRNIKLVDNLSNYSTEYFSASASTNTGAKSQPLTFADGNEIFTRLSAFEDDKRVDTVNKRLLPGSFCTTYDDYQHCKKNNLDPIERYALPNDEDIKWAFHFRPLKSDLLQRGIVEPANGHRGGWC